MLLSEIAAKLGGRLEGPDREIARLAGPAGATPNDLVVVRETRYLGVALTTGAALLVEEGIQVPGGISLIRVASVPGVWRQALEIFDTPEGWETQTHPSARVSPGARLGAGVVLGAFAVVEEGAVLEDQVVVGPFSYVGQGVQVGKESRLEARVVLQRGTLVGARCRILSGAVIGVAGFGFQDGARLSHAGRVVLEEGVEVGANTVIERSLAGETRVGAFSKIGGLCYIAHNCTIGKGVVMAGNNSLAGSVTVGDGVMFGGASGVSDHLKIGPGARIAAASIVTKDVPAGEAWVGLTPARPAREHWRRLALLDWLGGVEKKLKLLMGKNHD